MKSLLDKIKWDIKNSQVSSQDDFCLDLDDFEYLSTYVSRNDRITENEFAYYIVAQEKSDYVVDILTGWLKALIEELKNLLTHTISVLLNLTDILFSQISLLFGLCSSQTSTLFSAYFGTSLSRIPNF